MSLKKAYTKTIQIGQTEMDYVEFGEENKPLVIIPGLSDGFKTVKGKHFQLAAYYKEFSKRYKVYIFSRKNNLDKGYTTRDMAMDQKIAMDNLGLEKAYVIGLSQGGMVAQWLAIDYPEKVEKLVLGITVSKQNPTLQKVVTGWIDMAYANDYGDLIINTMLKTFTNKWIKKYKWLFPIIRIIGKPKSFDRFIVQANACLTHHSYDELEKIKCQTLVIGGDSDHVVGTNTSEEIAEKISKSKLIIYKGLGHGAYDENKDFNKQILSFLD